MKSTMPTESHTTKRIINFNEDKAPDRELPSPRAVSARAFMKQAPGSAGTGAAAASETASAMKSGKAVSADEGSGEAGTATGDASGVGGTAVEHMEQDGDGGGCFSAAGNSMAMLSIAGDIP